MNYFLSLISIIIEIFMKNIVFIIISMLVLTIIILFYVYNIPIKNFVQENEYTFITSRITKFNKRI